MDKSKLIDKYIKMYFNYSNYLSYLKFSKGGFDYNLSSLESNLFSDLVYLKRIKSNLDGFDVYEEGGFLFVKPKNLKVFLSLEFYIDGVNLGDNDVVIGEKTFSFKDGDIYVNGDKVEIKFEAKELKGFNDVFDVVFLMLKEEFKVDFEYVDSVLGSDYIKIYSSMSDLRGNKLFSTLEMICHLEDKGDHVEAFLRVS